MPFIGTKQIGAKPTVAGAIPKRYTYAWNISSPMLIGRYAPCVVQALPTVIDMTADPSVVIPFYSSGAAAFQYRVTLRYGTAGSQQDQDATFTPGQDVSSSTPKIENDISADSYVVQPAFAVRDGVRMISLGDDDNAGFGIRAVVSVGAGGNGQLAFCQLVNSTRTMRSLAGVPRTRGTNGQWWLDGQFPYSNQPTAYAAVTSGDAGGKEIFTDDIPGEALLKTDKYVQVQDDFRIYVMYRFGPDTAADHSIWVGLGYLEWGWRATASRASSLDDWVLIPGQQSSYRRPFQPGFGCPIQQGHMQAPEALLLRGGRHRK